MSASTSLASVTGSPRDDREITIGKLRRIYDLYRTSLLNRLYYSHQLAVYRKWNKTLEIWLAIGTCSALGGLAVFKTGTGATVWSVIAVAAFLCNILKPILQLPKGMEKYSKLCVGHSEVYYNLQDVVEDIRATKQLCANHLKQFNQALERYGKLAIEDDSEVSRKTRAKYEEEVNQQLPPKSFWVPPKIEGKVNEKQES